MSTALHDDVARARIRTAIDETVFVDAGAGTGKTAELVQRVVSLVASGAELRSIAAITFTEAAAAELRDRIRRALEQHALEGAEPRVPRPAADEVDEAAISTLHSFAQRILSEHPLAAGLPPGFEVLDELSSSIDFEVWWSKCLDAILTEPALAPVLLRGLAADVDPTKLEGVARAFHDHWDRLEDWYPGAPVPLSEPNLSGYIAAMRDFARAGRQPLVHPTLAQHAAEADAIAERLAGATGDEVVRLCLAYETPGALNVGSRTEPNNEVRDAIRRARESRDAFLAAIRAEVIEHLIVDLRDRVLQAADDRRRAGRLIFHDLLVFARRVARADVTARDALRTRYRFLLIDEFQDTDPIQVELAVRLAGASGDLRGIEAGRLFLVGDAQQSIYRFRRADVRQFLAVRDAIVAAPDRLLSNFRSVPGILDWVNAVVTALLAASGGAGFEPLVATRDAMAGVSPVRVLGEAHDGVRVADVRHREALDIARAIGLARDEGWLVSTPDGARPATWADMVVLMPTRATLGYLERAFDDAGIPYRVASASLVWSSQEARDLVSVLAAIDDPTDEVAFVAALRTAALGCGDDDLARWYRANGRWGIEARPASGLPDDDPVVDAVKRLRELHAKRWWTSLADMVELAARDLGLMEAAAGMRQRDRWRRLRYVVDQARAFEEASAGTLRDFVAWARRQADDDVRVREAVLPEADDDAVRIFTVHGAKGLEFPICVLTGLNAAERQNTGVHVVWEEDRPQAKLRKEVATRGYPSAADVEKREEAEERLRLLYVAATRARDHLIVSVHHKSGQRCHAAAISAVLGDFPELWRPCSLTTSPQLSGESRQSSDADGRLFDPDDADFLAEREDWVARRGARLDALARFPAISATELAEAEAEERPPWRRGRGGTALGRAVHAVLQSIDLATGEGLDDLAVATAVAEGVSARVDDVKRCVRNALASPTVEEAAASRHWREVFVAAPGENGMLVEGYIDLLYEGRDGLVVVDYKTDSITDDAALDQAVARHRAQLSAYRSAVEEGAGRPVTRCVLVFAAHGAERDL